MTEAEHGLMSILRGALTRAQRMVGGGLPENWEEKLAADYERDLGQRRLRPRSTPSARHWAAVRQARLERDRLYHLAAQDFTD